MGPIRSIRRLLNNKKNTLALSRQSTMGGSQSDLNKDFVAAATSGDDAVAIFEGEWASQIPGYKSGPVPLFDDERIKWLEQQCGGFAGKSVLELGPMEGGHTYMLWKGGATPIVSIEGNKRSYLKCLVTKELLGYNANFRLGDFASYLETTKDRYDFILASGVLYHMADPIHLLVNLCRVSDRIGIWTHYFDENVVLNSKALKKRFVLSGEKLKWHGKPITGYRQQYRRESNLLSFVGGNKPYSVWLKKEDIVTVLESMGYTVVLGRDNPQGKNGPEILLYAKKRS